MQRKAHRTGSRGLLCCYCCHDSRSDCYCCPNFYSRLRFLRLICVLVRISCIAIDLAISSACTEIASVSTPLLYRYRKHMGIGLARVAPKLSQSRRSGLDGKLRAVQTGCQPLSQAIRHRSALGENEDLRCCVRDMLTHLQNCCKGPSVRAGPSGNLGFGAPCCAGAAVAADLLLRPVHEGGAQPRRPYKV